MSSPAGLARVFAFASPANRAITGTASRFAAMRRKGYPELPGHRCARLGGLPVHACDAAQAIDIVDDGGNAHRYVFMLSRQRGTECPGCWMTDGVVDAPQEIELAI